MGTNGVAFMIFFFSGAGWMTGIGMVVSILAHADDCGAGRVSGLGETVARDGQDFVTVGSTGVSVVGYLKRTYQHESNLFLNIILPL